MKNLLIALVILSSLVSCGKNNKVSGAISGASPMVASTAIETDFVNKVNGNQFGTGLYYGLRFTDAIAHGANPKYQYANYAAPQVVQPNCHDAWIFRVCSSSTSSTYQPVTVAREVLNSSITVAAAQAKIVEIFSRKSSVDSNGIGGFRIRTTDNKTYYFETSLPIQANPTQTYNADGSGEWLFNIL